MIKTNYSSFANMLARTFFASTPRRTSCNTKPQRGLTMVASRFRSALCDASRLKNGCNTKPQRGVTMVASRFNGWYKADRKKRAFRYATLNPCRVPTARYSLTSSLPAIKMAGYHCQMPTASLAAICQHPHYQPFFKHGASQGVERKH